MRHIVYIMVLLAFSVTAKAQDIQAYKAEQLAARINNPDTFYVVNFWATWCGPCVKELPEMDKIQAQVNGKPVKLLLVSLDFKEAYPKKVAAFIKKKKLQHEVIWFNETNANEFIPKIDNSWQGSIPATLLKYKKTEYVKLFEGMITANMLTPLIEKQLSYQ